MVIPPLPVFAEQAGFTQGNCGNGLLVFFIVMLGIQCGAKGNTHGKTNTHPQWDIARSSTNGVTMDNPIHIQKGMAGVLFSGFF